MAAPPDKNLMTTLHVFLVELRPLYFVFFVHEIQLTTVKNSCCSGVFEPCSDGGRGAAANPQRLSPPPSPKPHHPIVQFGFVAGFLGPAILRSEKGSSFFARVF